MVVFVAIQLKIEAILIETTAIIMIDRTYRLVVIEESIVMNITFLSPN
jgi:hypothetical protein